MKQFIFNLFLALLLHLPLLTSAQCLSGNCQNGTGKMKYESGNTFEGTFRNGQRQQGVFTYTNGDRYEGGYLNNLRHGRGAYFYKSGNRFTGEYVNGEKTYGTLVYSNGNTYVGDFKNDKKHGKGIMYFADGKVLNGYWENDVFQPQTSRPAHGQTYAVIVGVQDYKNDVPGQFDDLRFTKDDAADYANFLRSPKGGLTPDGNIRLLYDTEASRDNILKVMREVFAKAKENDQVIFYFSGHGGEGAFAPYDFDPYTGGQLLYHRDVKAVFKSCIAKNKLCIADACHSGSIREKGGPAPKDLELAKPAQATLQTYYKALETQEEEYIAVLMSSRTDESSIESGAMAQSIFTYYLVNGLEGAANANGDQVITITELFAYLQKQVKASTQGEQNPVLFGKFPLDMPVVYL
jgi:hypothetical protein